MQKGKYYEKFTTEYFIDRAKKVHGDRYDYSESVYVSNHEKLKIICRIHGVFYTAPSNHYAGKGCPVCAGKVPMNTSRFLVRANEKHGDRYDYSLVKCDNNMSKVTIICKIHGPFVQLATKHVDAGHGCPECGGSRKKTTAEFIAQASKINPEYDYSLAVYKNDSSKVEVVCPTHGHFWQKAGDIIKGKKCAKCLWSRGNNKIVEVLDALSISYDREYRFSDCIEKRPLPFDVAVFNSDKSLAGLIEFDGEQHFKAVDYWGGQKNLELVQRHDAIKNNYCEEHNIPLLRIHFSKIKEVESIVKEYLISIKLLDG